MSGLSPGLLAVDQALRAQDAAAFVQACATVTPQALLTPVGTMGNSLLHELIHAGCPAAWASALLNRAPALLVQTNQSGTPPLMACLARGVDDPTDWFRTLLDAGAPSAPCNQRGETALHWAAARSDGLPFVRTLLERGNMVDPLDHQGYTPLFHATTCEVPAEVVRALLDAGADPRTGTRSPLDMAAQRSPTVLLPLLREQVVRLEQAVLRDELIRTGLETSLASMGRRRL